MKKTISAIIYARQSSGSDEQSDSVDTQVANCEEYCRDKGYKVKLVARDLNTSGRTYPISGASIAEQDIAFQEWFKTQSRIKKYREGLDVALTFLAQGDVLVVDELTRIYRGIKNSYLGNYIKQLLIRNNVMVETVKAGRFDPRSFNDELLETVQSHVNDQQISLGKQKSIEVRRRLTDEGVLACAARAVGLEYLGKHQYRIIDEYREVIQYVFEQITQYTPYSTIIRQVNSLFGDRFGKHFYESNFYHMAHQPLYCGYMHNTKGIAIKCQGLVGEPAVTYELWAKVQEILDRKRKVPTRARFRVLPFSGKLYCGKCGSKMVVVVDGKVLAYHCNGGTNLQGDKMCSRSRVRISDAHSDDYTGLRMAIAPLLVLGQYDLCLTAAGYAEDRKKMEKLKQEYQELQQKATTITNLYLKGGMAQIAYENAQNQVKARNKEYEQEMKKLQMHMSTDYKKKMLEDPFWGKFDQILEGKLDDVQYKELADLVINKITCYEEYIQVDTKYGCFKLDRLITTKARSFPRFTYNVVTDNHEQPKDITKCRLVVTYKYNDDRIKKLCINFPVMKVYMEGTKKIGANL